MTASTRDEIQPALHVVVGLFKSLPFFVYSCTCFTAGKQFPMNFNFVYSLRRTQTEKASPAGNYHFQSSSFAKHPPEIVSMFTEQTRNMTISLIAASNLNNRYLRILGKIFKESATAKLYCVRINSESKTNEPNRRKFERDNFNT